MKQKFLTVVQEGPGHRAQGCMGPWEQEVLVDQGGHEKDLRGAQEDHEGHP